MLAISFLNPALLYFAALAAIPVLIYLFNRQRYRPMKWAAMEFVLRAVRSNRRRLKVENLLLLLIRVATVLLIVLAVARPVARPFGLLADIGDRRQQIAIVLDASYSMGLKPGQKSSFERAQKAAHDVADEVLKRGDRLAVMVMADAPRWLYEDPVFIDDATKTRVLRDLTEVELTAMPGDGARMLSALAGYLPRFDGASAAGGAAALPKQVFIFTDLQRSAFASDRGLRDPGMRRAASELERLRAEVTIVDCGSDDPSNAGVTRLEAGDEVAGVDIPVKITASVKNFGPAPATDLELEFFVDSELTASPRISLEPGEEREVERFVTFLQKGAHRVQTVLKTDALATDNARALALEAREGVDVVVVDGEAAGEAPSEADYLAGAIAPAEEGRAIREYLLRPQVVPESALAEVDLSKEPVLALVNLIAPTGEQVEALEAFVRAGGGLLILLGPQTDAATWNEKVWKDGKGLLPLRVVEVVDTLPDKERYHVLEADTLHHPALRPFIGKEDRSLLGVPRFEAHWRLDWPESAPDDPTLQAVLWFAPRRATASGEAAATEAPAGGEGRGVSLGRSPALIEKRFGRGRVMIFAGTSDEGPGGEEWSNFPTQGAYAYVMLWTRVAKHLADAGTARKNLLAGEPYEAIVPSSEYSSEILLTTPQQDQIEKTLEKIPDEPDRFRLVHAETQKPGVYEVRYHVAADEIGKEGAPAGAGAGLERVEYFVVNVDPEEGDLARIEEKELRELLPELKFRLEKDRGERGLRAAERKVDLNELWRYALWAVLVLLVVESLVALAFGRRQATK